MIDVDKIKKNFLSQIEAAKILGVTQGRISILCKEGRFNNAFKIGGTWLIPTESVKNFKYKKRGAKNIKKETENLIKKTLQEDSYYKKLHSCNKNYDKDSD